MIDFISGLPRSGSTLLSALLRQNPRIHAGITSPVGTIFNAVLVAVSQNTEGAMFLNDHARWRLLKGVFESYYADFREDIIFDTNRMWTANVATLDKLFPDFKMLCCVRNPAWILDSVERVLAKNPFQVSGILEYDPNTTVYSRIEGLTKVNGLLGSAFAALREAVYGPFAKNIAIIRYESLVEDPYRVLERIYEFLGLPYFAHDVNHIEQIPGAAEFDQRIGTIGLHEVLPRVTIPTDVTLLPPDVFKRWSHDSFWDQPGVPALVI